ncbi:hypothetical protein RLEG12_26325 [Rhizobium leguminosarum bv. trifolii CB782]|uniref:Uncharacterized protein n=1 Tax=Rhizobium hidalgonense TaxID=1538159 RepID=A0A2A6KFL0_9HYPH|nr:hypothetical protein [Rhizobium hidalgonense]AHG46534.1 hypothetical protein RLEG12_26325 [Rhizobium leguminosarum bv. trifolii CB782]EJC77464.1 hypothetical protein Rleg10DRAFT_6171 [Rhizobium leguminosarum bv. trifolii WSM2012]MDR9773571.1 hypothetical protein [Rhizobium hidalgonense]MDR9807308.1 hypothetical protein [Rhizobium hidalgonense]MDR9811124.1 hypothetical protein [Rhizobium hidalgonense]
MNDQRPDGFTMIGLHKLAAQNGEGLVPELFEVFRQHAERQQIYQNVALFPTWEARMPGEAATRPLGEATANGNNVLAFPSRAARAGKRKA